jgi:ABC-2 type transport system permease protein
MHNIWLIARREYLERIRTRGFLITTVLIPLIMAGAVFGSAIMGGKAPTTIVVVSSDAALAQDLPAELQASGPKHLIVYSSVVGPDAASQRAVRKQLDANLIAGHMDGYLWIAPAASASAAPTFTYTPDSADASSETAPLTRALEKVLADEAAKHRGIVAAQVTAPEETVDIRVLPPPKHEDKDSAEVSVTVLFFLMYMVIMLYGMNVARSIIEEKTSRIFEVMLATIRPGEMMAGKIIGVGSVGLSQVVIWLTAAFLISHTKVAADLGGHTIHFALSTEQIVFFFVYFILGYLFYSSIAAALGAMTNSEQELQQLNMFLVLPLAFCFISLGRVMNAPDGHTARIMALIPPFTPLIMYLRISLGHPYLWEKLLSIALTSFSIYAIVWITSRIYRVGVLMYGKRPTLPEIFRWLKYS